MLIELHRTFTEETVVLKIENILYIRDLFYNFPGRWEQERGAEVCLNGYDYMFDSNGRSYKTRIKFGVVETVEQILTRLSVLKAE